MEKLKYCSIALISANLLLAEDIHLETLKVTTASKFSEDIKNTTSNISIITKEQIESRNLTTVADILNLASGINSISNGGVGSVEFLYLRGMSNKRVLILLNGVRLRDPSSISGADISQIMELDIERIEIIKGAQAGVWGSDAMAGVINIITKDIDSSAKASFEYGSFNSKKASATISKKWENFGVRVGANRVTSDSFSAVAPLGEDVDRFEDDRYENLTLNIASELKLKANSLIEFTLTDIDSKIDYDSYLTPDDSSLRSDIANRVYSLSFKERVGKHNFKLNYRNSKFNRVEVGAVASYASESVKEFDGVHQSLELSDRFNYSGVLNFAAGISEDRVEYRLTDESSNSQKSQAKYGYIINSNRFDRLILNQSIRYDSFENFENRFTLKLGAGYEISKNLRVSSNIATAYLTPNIMQELNPWGGVNMDLEPEDSKSFDFQVSYKNFKTTLFYSKIDNLIQWYDPDGYKGEAGVNRNLDGESKFSGVEIEYSQEIFRDTLFSFGYNYLIAKDKAGETLPNRPKNSFNSSIEYYGVKDFYFILDTEFKGAQYEWIDKGGYRSGGHLLANFILNYSFNKNSKAYFRVDNLTDKSYQVMQNYATEPRSFYGGVKISFN